MQIEERLTSIERELRQGRGERPEEMLKQLMLEMPRETLSQWKATLEPVIDRFMPKRKRRLRAFLDAEISGQPAEVRETVANSAYASALAVETVDYEAEFRSQLEDLSRRHIFQWATSYRDCLFEHFDRYLSRMKKQPQTSPETELRRCLSEHSHAIFAKGYGHERDAKNTAHDRAVHKSIGGLERFLELPLDYYISQTSNSYRQRPVLALRKLFSAACLGIIEGYAKVRFGAEHGGLLLPKFSYRWGYNLAFLTPAAAKEMTGLLDVGPLTEGIKCSVIPLLDSIDRLIHKPREDYFPLPLSSRFSWRDRLLDIGLRAPLSVSSHPLMEARAYLDAESASTRALREARSRNMALVVTPLKPDARAFVRDKEELGDIVVEADGAESRAVADKAEQVWGRRIYDLRSKRLGEAISHNVARLFPISEVNLMPFYRVQRTSVRNLARTFDRTKNGVRLWCSVRRSGKTTACFGLDFTGTNFVIIPQTCGTGPTANARGFFDKVCKAVESGALLAENFVDVSVAECSPVPDDGKRKVLIVDEYETLFAFLRAASEQNAYVRFTVVQPLLNQLVEFARDNLLVLLGQQPDAHFILMDQNQLAPYVRQEPFPLFEHDTGTRAGEFSELVGKILTEGIGFDPGFLDGLHRETAGHPFLTVNVLCSLVDWLIEQKRPYRGLKLHHQDFAEFRETRLKTNLMAMSQDFAFFRHAIEQAMSERGYHDNPWLFTVYWVLQAISRSAPDDLSVPRSSLPDLLNRIPAPGPLPDHLEILRTATQANFLQCSEEDVGVKIRTLGRMAAAIRPALA